jgi:hypothetical protein
MPFDPDADLVFDALLARACQGDHATAAAIAPRLHLLLIQYISPELDDPYDLDTAMRLADDVVADVLEGRVPPGQRPDQTLIRVLHLAYARARRHLRELRAKHNLDDNDL